MNGGLDWYAGVGIVLSLRGPSVLPIFYISPCPEDSRANRLASWSFRPNGGVTSIYLCTATDVVDALTSGLVHLGYRVFRLEVTDPDDRRKWTHALEINGVPSPEVEGLLNLLSETLVLRRLPSIESAMVLDWYKDPTSDEDPNNWAYTPVGKLVHGCKYAGRVNDLRLLCDRLAEVIGRHPVYRESVLATVPGHNTKVTSNGERVAAGVAKRLDLPLIKTTARTAVRPEAKSGEAFDLTGEFSMDETASLQRVLIVDDLYHSGKTMSEVAAAAKRAGALSVHGIAGVRIMRK
jgi:predicted amidophosphoribosyltransferase